MIIGSILPSYLSDIAIQSTTLNYNMNDIKFPRVVVSRSRHNKLKNIAFHKNKRIADVLEIQLKHYEMILNQIKKRDIDHIPTIEY